MISYYGGLWPSLLESSQVRIIELGLDQVGRTRGEQETLRTESIWSIVIIQYLG